MTEIEKEKIKDIVVENDFSSFWEVLEYLKIAGYEETKAIMFASTLFDGKVWDNVISADTIKREVNFQYNGHVVRNVVNEELTASTMTVSWVQPENIDGLLHERVLDEIMEDVNDMAEDSIKCEKHDGDESFVEIFILTKKANPNCMSLYQAYLKSRNYEIIEELETHIKSIKLELESQLATEMFKQWLIVQILRENRKRL